MPEHAYVYILASSFQKLYIGVTTNLERRLFEHRNASDPNSFTARYRIHKLVHVESFFRITSAIAREKQLKRWSRIKKIRLIVTGNPTWQDLSQCWGELIPPPTP